MTQAIQRLPLFVTTSGLRLLASLVVLVGLMGMMKDAVSAPPAPQPAQHQWKQLESAPGVLQIQIFRLRQDIPNGTAPIGRDVFRDQTGEEFQGDVNAWLRQNYDKIEVTGVLQSESSDRSSTQKTTITILYKRK